MSDELLKALLRKYPYEQAVEEFKKRKERWQMPPVPIKILKKGKDQSAS